MRIERAAGRGRAGSRHASPRRLPADPCRGLDEAGACDGSARQSREHCGALPEERRGSCGAGEDGRSRGALMRIGVLCLDDVFDTGVAALLDTFETADQLAGAEQQRRPSSAEGFSARPIAVRRRVRTHHGFAIDAAAPPSRPPDLVVVPAIACKDPATLLPALERDDVRDAMELLRKWHARGVRVAAACTGTFILGRAGLLDGKRATTTWWLGPTFRASFPKAELDESCMVVADGAVVTAGAALAHLDLALAIIREKSPRLASSVARHLVLEDRASQAPFVLADHVALDDELVKRFEVYARRRIGAAFDLPAAARALGASERTLQRRVRAVLGKSPIAFVQDLRLERAVHLLRTTRRSVDDVAAAVGYEDASTLRTLLRRKLRLGVRELRG